MSFYAGPHWERGLETMNDALRGYWSTGVVAGNAADIEALGPGGKGFSNPTFMDTSFSETFKVHFTSGKYICIGSCRSCGGKYLANYP